MYKNSYIESKCKRFHFVKTHFGDTVILRKRIGYEDSDEMIIWEVWGIENGHINFERKFVRDKEIIRYVEMVDLNIKKEDILLSQEITEFIDYYNSLKITHFLENI